METEIAVANETKSSFRRTTRDGRNLLYKMEVIQQPEQARACGSGAKCKSTAERAPEEATNNLPASADRRPVDPPPVVELKIYECDGDDQKDITFAHDANFFLYTTLENARPIAHGRVVSTYNTLPVLTGTPVAGMAYLDRPNAAGYFIFPDLSVRHEGKYRLSFNLYEELKDPKDVDIDLPEGIPNTRDKLLLSNPLAPRSHVHFRLEVKSQSFVVFSAKKFPGLKESTSLSRMVAEQGCRVRIRRDVRMRRRDKATEHYQEVIDERHYPSDRYATPRQAPERSRSISNSSIDAPTPYTPVRRLSIPEGPYGQAASYQQPPPPAPTNSASSYHSHLSFGGPHTPHYQTPTIAAPPPPLPALPHLYTQISPSYQNPSITHARQMSAPQSFNYPPSQPQQPQSPYGQCPTYVDNSPSSYDHRRASAGMTPVRSYMPEASYTQSHPAIQQQISQQSPSRSLTPINTKPPGPPPSLPPITTLVAHTPIDLKNEPVSTTSAMPQGPQNPYSAGASSHTSSSYNPYSSSTPQSASQTKRAHGSAFDQSSLDSRMQSGMRPDISYHGQDVIQVENFDGKMVDPHNALGKDLSVPLVFKRANGSFSTINAQSLRSKLVYPRS